eukprot:4447472-Pyramimonas_sp.AAC.1
MGRARTRALDGLKGRVHSLPWTKQARAFQSLLRPTMEVCVWGAIFAFLATASMNLDTLTRL